MRTIHSQNRRMVGVTAFLRLLQLVTFYVGSTSFVSAASFYYTGTGHYYEPVYVPSGITRDAADAAATAAGGYLVSIMNSDENDFVFSLVDATYFSGVSINNDRMGPWLGGVNTASGWTWSSGELFAFAPWVPGQPDNYGDACGGGFQYTIFYAGINVGSTWADHPGDPIPGYDLPNGYIIEFTQAPEPSTVIILLTGATLCLRRRWLRTHERSV